MTLFYLGLTSGSLAYFNFFFFFFSFWHAGCIISFLVLETLIKESQFSWMSYKHIYLIGLQREKKKKIP